MVKGVWFLIEISGISNTISISKTKKTTASKKNRRENGCRADFLGSNPHSKGESFSRSLRAAADKKAAIIRITTGTRPPRISESIMVGITLS